MLYFSHLEGKKNAKNNFNIACNIHYQLLISFYKGFWGMVLNRNLRSSCIEQLEAETHFLIVSKYC